MYIYLTLIYVSLCTNLLMYTTFLSCFRYFFTFSSSSKSTEVKGAKLSSDNPWMA